MYNVVTRTIASGTHTGVITRTLFKSKADFDQWNDEKMKSWYEVVEEGVSEERAVELCSSKEAQLAVETASLREVEEHMKKIRRLASSILEDVATLLCPIKLGEKTGDGVGAGLDFFTPDDVYIGHLTFHEGGDWLVTDSSNVAECGWEEVFEPALELAQEQYPNG